MDCSTDQELRTLIEAGCDERLFLNAKTGLNKYHLDPMLYTGSHYRGSCTCGSLTPFTWPIAVKAAERVRQSGSREFNQWAEEQRNRLKALIGGEVAFDVFFGPSGSDLLYLPLLFRAIIDERPLLNVVSCPEELGSGSNLAAEGRYHGEYGAFGDHLEKGASLSKRLKPDVIRLGARTDDGNIRSRCDDIREALLAYPSHNAIVNLVYGSKSGIEDDLAIIDPAQDVLWTVDLCQFRADPGLIQGLLAKGAMVLITGSKFYNAPPFCGALLVPEKWTSRLEGRDVSLFSALSNLFARDDIPVKFNAVQQTLTQESNPSSRLRWDCALAEMEAYSRLSRDRANEVIQQWNRTVLARLDSSKNFELMPDQQETNPSIVSFRVVRDGTFFSHEELQALFARFVRKAFIGAYGFKRVFIGQPVRYGDRSFIRFALGSWAVRQQVAKVKPDWRADGEMIEALEREVRLFERTGVGE